MTIPNTPTLAEVIRIAVVSRLADLRVCLPAVVDAYDATKGTVEVVPLLMVPAQDDQGNATVVQLPKVVGVPVLFPGGGGARTTYPIAKGDFVTLVFADRSLDVWKGNASTTPVDPAAQNSHDDADAFAIPGLKAPSAPWANAPTDRVSIGYDTGERIEVLPGEIDLGHGATEKAVLGTTYRNAEHTAFSTLQTQLTAAATALTAAAASSVPLLLPPAAAAHAAALTAAVTALTAAAAALTTMEAAAATYLSGTVKVGA